eukprot:8538510-Pyramimonas_sp.AAC.2
MMWLSTVCRAHREGVWEGHHAAVKLLLSFGDYAVSVGEDNRMLGSGQKRLRAPLDPRLTHRVEERHNRVRINDHRSFAVRCGSRAITRAP